jgi:hypothetical protein
VPDDLLIFSHAKLRAGEVIPVQGKRFYHLGHLQGSTHSKTKSWLFWSASGRRDMDTKEALFFSLTVWFRSRPIGLTHLKSWPRGLNSNSFLKMIHNQIKHTISNKYEYYNN